MPHRRPHWLFAITLLASAIAHAAPNEREQKVRGDKQKMDADDFWIYNDLERGQLTGKREGKPLMVAFRCIP